MEAETYPFIANAEKIFLESMHAWRGGLKTSRRGIAVLSMCIDKVLCVQTLFVEEKFPGHRNLWILLHYSSEMSQRQNVIMLNFNFLNAGILFF